MGVRLWCSLRLLRYFLMFSWNANERHQSVAGNFSTVPAFSTSLKGNSQREQLDVYIQHRPFLGCCCFLQKCTKSPLAWFLNEVQKPIRICSGPRRLKVTAGIYNQNVSFVLALHHIYGLSPSSPLLIFLALMKMGKETLSFYFPVMICINFANFHYIILLYSKISIKANCVEIISTLSVPTILYFIFSFFYYSGNVFTSSHF